MLKVARVSNQLDKAVQDVGRPKYLKLLTKFPGVQEVVFYWGFCPTSWPPVTINFQLKNQIHISIGIMARRSQMGSLVRMIAQISKGEDDKHEPILR